MIVSMANGLRVSGTERLREAEECQKIPLHPSPTIAKQGTEYTEMDAHPILVLHTSAMLLMTIAMIMP